MQIRRATSADRQRWDTYVAGHPEGTPYQFWAWQQAVEKAYGYHHQYLVAEEETEICGILPLIDFRLPWRSSRLISLPFCDAGGVLTRDPDVAAALIERAENFANGQLRAILPQKPDQTNQTNKVRMVLELPDSSAALLDGMKSKLRSQVKKPQRDGLTARLGRQELVDAFYSVFSENMRDLGSPVHSRRWIDAVVEAYGDNCRVGTVYTPQGEIAAAGIILLHPGLVVIPWASARRQFNTMNPNMLLYWSFLSFACDRGYPRFDFGRSTPQEGTYRFKKQWGATPQPLYWYDLCADHVEKSAPVTSGTSPLRHWVTSLWQKLPLPVANTLGPELRKYISL
ncbi:FemAB family XrtA/PEP-CTERM system-associated protein [uncultured Desulfuromonas sp.]|uniref:FemAB family XrtA/PEP-CTERM system-associated protein n=1 Tax=uncultured Desulfuromonas sp. TaxID=181013 RepID=UPI002AABF5B7|nr:FemAB family XrtA/PEP-CTERM system-associated protein [uncultured Desulfuromonas sp.]